MTWEAVTALSTLVSAIVVAVAAVAAVLQIRHLRAGNQLDAILRIYDTFNGSEMVQARRYCLNELPAALADETSRAALLRGEIDPRLTLVGNFSNEIGALVADGFLDARLILPLVPLTARLWRIAEPVAIEWRKRRADPIWADFEFIAALDERASRREYIARYPAWFQARFK